MKSICKCVCQQANESPKNLIIGLGVTDFEFTCECIVFDLLQIGLYHGWLVEPQDEVTFKAVNGLSYNQLIDKIISKSGKFVSYFSFFCVLLLEQLKYLSASFFFNQPSKGLCNKEHYWSLLSFLYKFYVKIHTL